MDIYLQSKNYLSPYHENNFLEYSFQKFRNSKKKSFGIFFANFFLRDFFTFDVCRFLFGAISWEILHFCGTFRFVGKLQRNFVFSFKNFEKKNFLGIFCQLFGGKFFICDVCEILCPFFFLNNFEKFSIFWEILHFFRTFRFVGKFRFFHHKFRNSKN